MRSIAHHDHGQKPERMKFLRIIFGCPEGVRKWRILFFCYSSCGWVKWWCFRSNPSRR